MTTCYTEVEKCPSCGKKGGLISSIAQKETYTTKSNGSISGLGVNLSSSGLGLMPVVGGMSQTNITKSKRAELFTEPEEPKSALSTVYIALILCVFAAGGFHFLFQEGMFSSFSRNEFNLFSDDLLSVLGILVPFLMIAPIVYIMIFNGNIEKQDNITVKKHKNLLRRYNSTRICEDCDLLFNNELKKTSNITEEGLEYMIYSGANSSDVKKGACK